MKQLLIALALVIAADPATARAAPPADVEKRERDALAACDGQDIKGGIALLGRLYADTLDPTYIYNQARCYQKNEHNREAVGRFREFLRVTKEPTGELAQRARGAIAELELLLAAPTPAPAPPPPPSVAPALSPSDVSAGSVTTSARAPGGLRPLQIGGLVAGGLGLAGLGTGVYFSLRVRTLEGEAERLSNDLGKDHPNVRSKLTAGDAAERRQWIGYGVGAALVGAGAALFFLGRDGDGAVAFAPLVSAGVCGATVGGNF